MLQFKEVTSNESDLITESLDRRAMKSQGQRSQGLTPAVAVLNSHHIPARWREWAPQVAFSASVSGSLISLFLQAKTHKVVIDFGLSLTLHIQSTNKSPQLRLLTASRICPFLTTGSTVTVLGPSYHPHLDGHGLVMLLLASAAPLPLLFTQQSEGAF